MVQINTQKWFGPVILTFLRDPVTEPGLVEITQKFLRHIRHFDGFMTSSMSDFFVILQFFATGSVIKCVETLDFHIEYVF